MSNPHASGHTASTAIGERLAVLERRLQESATAASRRRTRTGIVLGVLVLGVAGYLAWLHATIKTFAEPDTLVELAAATLQPRLEEEVDRVGERLVAEAPALLDQAERMVLDSPPQLVAGAGDYLASQFDGHITLLEERVYALVSGMLKESLDRARAEGIDLEDDAQVDALVDQAAPLMRAELKKAVDEIYAEYRKSADGFGTVVDRLTGGEALDAAEERRKEILVSGLAIIRKLEADPSRAPVQGVIRGEVPQGR